MYTCEVPLVPLDVTARSCVRLKLAYTIFLVQTRERIFGYLGVPRHSLMQLESHLPSTPRSKAWHVQDRISQDAHLGKDAVHCAARS